MSLAEKAKTVQPRHTMPGPKCAVRKALPQLSQEDADAVLDLIYQRRDLTAAEVADLFREERIDISDDSVRRHRLHRCRNCQRG